MKLTKARKRGLGGALANLRLTCVPLTTTNSHWSPCRLRSRESVGCLWHRKATVLCQAYGVLVSGTPIPLPSVYWVTPYLAPATARVGRRHLTSPRFSGRGVAATPLSRDRARAAESTSHSAPRAGVGVGLRLRGFSCCRSTGQRLPGVEPCAGCDG